ncbi:DinB family protein [Bacillus paralicheniformis]|uniref:DinB-like domain-containing protein n=1 Tax=Bacillus paralicheniformis TaxID=1648923 RepID=A0A7Z0WZ90_9BACI|nr:DinB family protein [Bacillus paralicheniformis]MBC8622745.1 DinB family protein [Robertmurraya crescens]MBL7477276.1 DinB family protein [Bacillus paralicheniformis]MCW4364675.1 DinB family protein [Bacillus paralicheniformis]MDU0413953.1 DinB family protein [Bacillus paralicheniformis]MED1129060.1 DinB family protein [Bacillus paralicheniformis]
MNFQLEEAIEILERTPQTLSQLLTGLSSPWISCDEGADTWNAFDVVGHLIEGEKNNWLPRIKLIVTKGATEPFPPFDRFSQLNQNDGKTMEQLLNEFADIRRANLKTLQQIIDPETDFEQTGMHPEFGIVKLREQISTWVAHDLTHISQIARVLAKRYQDDVGPWRAYLRILAD